jgi:hypothetical protein
MKKITFFVAFIVLSVCFSFLVLPNKSLKGLCQEDYNRIEFTVNSSIASFFQGNTKINETNIRQGTKTAVIKNINNRTYVPLQFFIDQSVITTQGNIVVSAEYDTVTKEVSAFFRTGYSDQDLSISLSTGSKQAIRNGENLSLDVSVPSTKLTGGFPCFPIRFIFEAFDYNVDWEASSQKISVVTQNQ